MATGTPWASCPGGWHLVKGGRVGEVRRLVLFHSHSASSAKELFPPTFLKVIFIRGEKKYMAALQVCKYLVLQRVI